MAYHQAQPDYFNKRPGDIRWAHAVNSRNRLMENLQGGKVDFLEIDVSMSADGEPIAAHPPTTKSDLRITELLEQTSGSKLGKKFDFKDDTTVLPVLQLLATNPSSGPIILNADILPTDPRKLPTIKPAWFIETCQSLSPGNLLSLGWRTDDEGPFTYTSEHIVQMLNICENLPVVTFPIRASMLEDSWEQVQRLLEKPGRTLTLWNSGPLPASKRKWIRAHTSPDTCFYDIDLSV